MSSVIYYLQEARTGRVRVDVCQAERLRMRIGQLQAGNPELLLVRALYEGDAAALAAIAARQREHRITEHWYRAAVLDARPDLPAVAFDAEAEQRRVAVRAMHDLANQGSA
jgi:hypothetical protein